MKFWDSSAVIPLLVDEPESRALLDQVNQDSDLVVWWATAVACASALARRRREGTLSEADERAALDLLTTLADSWTEVQPTAAVREGAIRLVRVHTLRSADALQLSAAMAWVSGRTRQAGFVTRDERQRIAAEREGFSTL